MFLSNCMRVHRVCVHSHTDLHTTDLSTYEGSNSHKLSLPISIFFKYKHTLTQSFPCHSRDLENEHEHAYLPHTDLRRFNFVYALAWSIASSVCKKRLASPLLCSPLLFTTSPTALYTLKSTTFSWKLVPSGYFYGLPIFPPK